MDVTRIAGIGRDLRTRLRTFFDTPIDRDATPLEICQAVLDEVETRIEPAGRGRRVFPYTAMHVRVLAPAGAHAPMAAAFDGFAGRVRERLGELRCDALATPEVELTCVDEAPSGWPPGRVFDVTYTRLAGPQSRPTGDVPPDVPPTLSVTVLKGASTAPTYSFLATTVSIGRSADPTDDLGRLRRNCIAFTDVVDGITETVGRAHARLRFDREHGHYRLYDEGSSNGTAIVRDGEVIVVARRDPRGVRLRSGDEIQVGRALLRVAIG